MVFIIENFSLLISVIIPTCNRNNLLGICLDGLNPLIQNISSDQYEVIVTDDSKEDAAQYFIANGYTWVKWVAGKKKGPAANRNNGAKHAKSKWLVFIDDDVLPDKNLLNNYKQNIEAHPNILAFEGAILPDNWDLLKKDLAECPVNTNGNCFWSANICIEKKLFDNIGGFNEQFVIAAQEDQEIYARLIQKTVILFCKESIVIHPVRYRTLKEKIKRIPLEIKNWILFARLKHSWARIFWDGTLSQLKACFRTMQQNKLRMMVYHFLSLAYLAPAIILFVFKHNGRQKI